MVLLLLCYLLSLECYLSQKLCIARCVKAGFYWRQGKLSRVIMSASQNEAQTGCDLTLC